MRKSLVAGVAALGLLAAFAYWVGNRWDPEPPGWSGAECRVQTDGQVRLDREQLANAATITATGARLGMPERATVVALATALQESKLHNLPHLGAQNDHDSIGLFQQRPSQGWGTAEQLSDPRFAAERFYQALAQVHDWQRLRVTEAAQQVQRSAFPEAYQQWEQDATVLAAALLGNAGAAVTCRPTDESPASSGADAVHRQLSQDWGAQVAATAADGILQVAADDRPSGWRYAHWLVAHAHTLGVRAVHFQELSWHSTTGDWQQAGEQSDQLGADHVRAELHT